jgi:hypothetical protein
MSRSATPSMPRPQIDCRHVPRQPAAGAPRINGELLMRKVEALNRPSAGICPALPTTIPGLEDFSLRRSATSSDSRPRRSSRSCLYTPHPCNADQGSPTAPCSPWHNGYAERLIGSIQRESLDHLIVFDEAPLPRVLKNSAIYYNQFQTHLSLDKDAPDFRRLQKLGSIAAMPILGGPHHQYVGV